MAKKRKVSVADPRKRTGAMSQAYRGMSKGRGEAQGAGEIVLARPPSFGPVPFRMTTKSNLAALGEARAK